MLCPHFEGYDFSVFPLRISGLERPQGGPPFSLTLGSALKTRVKTFYKVGTDMTTVCFDQTRSYFS